MKVLLTGATGFIGRHVLQHMRDKAIPFVTVGRSIPSGCIESEFIQADLLASFDYKKIMEQAEATHLLHLAWYADHGKYWTSPLNLRWVEATVRLVEAFCMAGGKRVVAAGTCAEYDWSYGYCREDVTPTNPDTLYGVAKDATRRLVMAICKDHGASCVWGRVFIPYGPGEHRERLIPSLARVFYGIDKAFAVSADDQRDFMHVMDVASAFTFLTSINTDGIVNICNGKATEILEVIKIISLVSGINHEKIFENKHNLQSKCPVLIGDNSKLCALGWKARYALESGIKMYLDFISNKSQI